MSGRRTSYTIIMDILEEELGIENPCQSIYLAALIMDELVANGWTVNPWQPGGDDEDHEEDLRRGITA